jgi:hypothetical protein
MADETIGGEGIRQDWRIDKKATNYNKLQTTTNYKLQTTKRKQTTAIAANSNSSKQQ